MMPAGFRVKQPAGFIRTASDDLCLFSAIFAAVSGGLVIIIPKISIPKKYGILNFYLTKG